MLFSAAIVAFLGATLASAEKNSNGITRISIHAKLLPQLPSEIVCAVNGLDRADLTVANLLSLKSLLGQDELSILSQLDALCNGLLSGGLDALRVCVNKGFAICQDQDESQEPKNEEIPVVEPSKASVIIAKIKATYEALSEEARDALIAEINGVIVFKIILENGEEQIFHLDLKSSPGSVGEGYPEGDIDTLITAKDADFADLVAGRVSGLGAVLRGLIVVEGDRTPARKLETLFRRLAGQDSEAEKAEGESADAEKAEEESADAENDEKALDELAEIAQELAADEEQLVQSEQSSEEN